MLIRRLLREVSSTLQFCCCLFVVDEWNGLRNEMKRERDNSNSNSKNRARAYLLRYFAMEMEGSVGESKDFNRECDLLLDFDSEDGITSFYSFFLSLYLTLL